MNDLLAHFRLTDRPSRQAGGRVELASSRPRATRNETTAFESCRPIGEHRHSAESGLDPPDPQSGNAVRTGPEPNLLPPPLHEATRGAGPDAALGIHREIGYAPVVRMDDHLAGAGGEDQGNGENDFRTSVRL